MQKKLAAGMLLACVCAPAIAESGWYTGVSVAQATLDDRIYGVSIEAEGTGYKLFTGYRFSEYGSLEASYAAGTADDTVMGVYIESDARALQGSALWQIPVSAMFQFYARFSFIAWETDNSAKYGVTRFSQENDGTDLAFGFGASLELTPRFAFRAEIEGAELDGTDLRLLSFGALYRF